MSSASDRSEKATPKKREDARLKGQFARGAELPAALSFLGAVFAMKFIGFEIFNTVGAYLQATSSNIAAAKPLTDASLQILVVDAVKVWGMLALPVVAVGLVAVVAGNLAQGGFSFSIDPLTPKPEKFNPITNAKRIFGLDSVVNLVKSFVKLLLISSVGYGVLLPIFETAPLFIHAPLPTIVAKLGEVLFALGFRCGLVLLGLAAADYGYAWYKHEKSLRMTKQEIRDEYKQQEGDPMVKGQRRRAARALTQRRSISAVPTASVVITNPTHFAVALRYDRDDDAAPVVVAKGADVIAAKIRQLATEHNVPLIENPPLARALYKMVEPNQIIPAEFFAPVAEILAYVFRQKEI